MTDLTLEQEIDLMAEVYKALIRGAIEEIEEEEREWTTS